MLKVFQELSFLLGEHEITVHRRGGAFGSDFLLVEWGRHLDEG
jgi:hypothetical protein